MQNATTVAHSSGNLRKHQIIYTHIIQIYYLMTGCVATIDLAMDKQSSREGYLLNLSIAEATSEMNRHF